MAENLTYEQALAELETITQKMESGTLPLEDSVQAYKRGMELLKICRTKLARAEKDIRKFEESGELTELPDSELREDSAGDDSSQPGTEDSGSGSRDDDIPF